MRISDWSSDVCSSDLLPMLPTALSNGWCSLNPREDRPCMAVHLWIDAKGKELRHRFVRGLMRSAARLTYEEVQAARDALPSGDNETGASHHAPRIEAALPGLSRPFPALPAAPPHPGTPPPP